MAIQHQVQHQSQPQTHNLVHQQLQQHQQQVENKSNEQQLLQQHQITFLTNNQLQVHQHQQTQQSPQQVLKKSGQPQQNSEIIRQLNLNSHQLTTLDPPRIELGQQRIQTQPQQQQRQTHSGQQQQQRNKRNGDGNDQKHKCKYCDKSFATKWYLDQHEKIHTGEAETCDICNKTFVTRWHLGKHKRVHENENAKKKNKRLILEQEQRERLASKNLQKTSVDSLHTSEITSYPSDITIQQHHQVGGIQQQQQIKSVLVNNIDEVQHHIQVHGDQPAGENTSNQVNNNQASSNYSHSQYFVTPKSQEQSIDGTETSCHGRNRKSSQDQHSTIDKSQLSNPITPYNMS